MSLRSLPLSAAPARHAASVLSHLPLPDTVRHAPLCGFDGLHAEVRRRCDEDPLSGHLFNFIGKRKHHLKIRFWSDGGLCVFSKRLEQGQFVLPKVEPGQTAVRLQPVDLAMLLTGIDLQQVQRQKHFQPRRSLALGDRQTQRIWDLTACILTDSRSLDHFSNWQSQVVSLAKVIAAQDVALQAERKKNLELQQEVEAYNRRLRPKALQKKRADGRKWKEELPTDDVVLLVPDALPPCEQPPWPI